jgi:RNA recognition motif-containing protein
VLKRDFRLHPLLPLPHPSKKKGAISSTSPDHFVMMLLAHVPEILEEWNAFIVAPDHPNDVGPCDTTGLEAEFQWLFALMDSFNDSGNKFHLNSKSDLEERRVEITNFDPDTTTETTVMEVGLKFGDVQSVDLRSKSDGRIFLTFFDIRHAQAIVREKINIQRRMWIIQFAPPEEILDLKHPPNNGTVVVFAGLDKIPAEAIRSEFSVFGEIREIRSSKSAEGFKTGKEKPTHQDFIEFWDIRAAERAIAFLKKQALFGRKLSIEFSRPGGYRKNSERFMNNRIPTVMRKSKKEHTGIRIITQSNQNVVPNEVLTSPKISRVTRSWPLDQKNKYDAFSSTIN